MTSARAAETRATTGWPRVGFRPSSRSRVRIAVGALMSLVAVGVVLFVFSTTDKRVAVLQAVHDLPAGSQVQPADVRSIEVSVDPSLAVVAATDLGAVVGQYTKVRIVSGGLLSTALLQPAPLVTAGAAIVAVTVPPGELPSGLRERSRVEVVIPADTDQPAPAPVRARVVGLPSTPDATTGAMSVSLEVAIADAVVVANARKPRVVLLDPGADPAEVVP